MKEITFINLNKKRWSAFEEEVAGKRNNIDPDSLADSYIQLTDDLSYARTFFPESNIIPYLNGLSSSAHTLIYRNKKEKTSRLKTFWITELPLAIYEARKQFFVSLIVFIIAMVLGAASAFSDDNFIRIILGNEYVNQTLDNIEKGDPMAVYEGMKEIPMFLTITMNNIFVSFVTFLFGILTPIGTGFILFRNGIMVGAFQAFFAQKSLVTVSTLAIMIHGTLELSALVLAGGAGFVLGSSLLFPKTYPRNVSLVMGAKRGTKIMLGLVPFFIMAGFLESFITRYYDTLSLFVNLLIIIVSLFLIIGYFVIYPRIVYLKTVQNGKTNSNS